MTESCANNMRPGMGKADGRVTAIVINYNGAQTIGRCLESISAQTFPVSVTIVVDNSSSDESIRIVEREHARVKVIKNETNLGWGVGCNVGMGACDSEFVLILNNDAYMDERCVETMVRKLRDDTRVGSVASRILLWGQPDTIEAAGVAIFPDGSSLGRGRLSKSESYVDECEVFCANDCCCMYRLRMLLDIGPYDPDFFIYCDETDMGWRQQLAGWRCLYVPEAIAYHAHSRAAGSYTDFKLYHVERNRMYICLKYFPMIDLLKAVVISFVRYILHAVHSFMGRGALWQYRKESSMTHGVLVLFRAHVAVCRKLVVMLRRRGEIMRRWKPRHRDIVRLFVRYGVTMKEMVTYE